MATTPTRPLNSDEAQADLKIKIAIADDFPAIIEGLMNCLSPYPFFSIQFHASNGMELLKLLEKNEIDLLILDHRMPELNGIDAMAEISRRYPAVKVILYSFLADHLKADELRDLGIDAVIKKNTPLSDLINTLLAVHAQPKVRRKNTFTEGEVVMRLTKTETQILELLEDNRSTTEITSSLNITKRTLEKHRSNILKKTNSKNLIAALKKLLWAFRDK